MKLLYQESKLIIYILASLFISFGSIAGTDGKNKMSKSSNGEIKDCFEGLNRGIFAFNQALDTFIIEPVAKGYRVLPSPVCISAIFP